MKVAYFVHDLSDAAAARRVQMLRAGGADMAIAGFRRTEKPVVALAGIPALDLGRTFDGRLAHRAGLVARHSASVRAFREIAAGADIVLARNLEMLAIAAAARRVHAPRAKLVYECLDIHRVMCGAGVASIALRELERVLLGACSSVLVSAPAFATEYFRRRHRHLPPLLLVENKVLAPLAGVARPAAGTRTAGAPWKIGWFGNLRCRKSLLMLREIAARARGGVEVVMRGRVSPLTLPDFETLTAGAPNIRYLGPYSQADLARLYGEVHFAWSVDYTDEGLNSDWLLPNRIYEGGFFNTPSLAERRKAIGAWLAEKGAGVLLDDPVEDALRFFAGLTPEAYKVLEQRSAAIDSAALAFDPAGCVELLGALAAAERPAASAIRTSLAGPGVAGNKS